MIGPPRRQELVCRTVLRRLRLSLGDRDPELGTFIQMEVREIVKHEWEVKLKFDPLYQPCFAEGI